MSAELYYDVRWQAAQSEGRPGNPRRIELVTRTAATWISRRNYTSLLDVGAGNGWILERISREVSPSILLHALEPSAIGAENTRLRVPHAHVWNCMLEDLPHATQYDVVCCSEVIEHTPDHRNFIEQLASRITLGGTLILTTPNGKYRSTYFASTGVKPQPIENWLAPRVLAKLISTDFAIHTHKSFELNYFYGRHRILNRIARQFRRSKLGRRWTESVERLATDRAFCGLYQLVVAEKR